MIMLGDIARDIGEQKKVDKFVEADPFTLLGRHTSS